MVKGWFDETRRHRLARLGIKTGRKVRGKTGVLGILNTKDSSMFYPKGKVEVGKDTEKITAEQPITILKSVSEIATQRKLDYPNDNKGKKIVTGALIGGAVGALTYSNRNSENLRHVVVRSQPKLKNWVVVWKIKGKGWRKKVVKTQKEAFKFSSKLREVEKLNYPKDNPLPKGTRYAFDEPIKTGKYKGLRPRYAFVNNKVVEIAYFKGKKKVAVKKLDYPENDVEDITIKTQVEGVDITKKPIEETMEIEKVKKKGFKERVKAVGRGAKTTFEKGRELSEKLQVMKQEKEIRDLEKSQKKLLSLKTKLQVAQTKEQIESARERIRKTSPSVLGDFFRAPEKKPKKKFKSILDA